jgi:hypothetical protein
LTPPKKSTAKITAPLKEITNENNLNQMPNPTENFSLISTRNLIQASTNLKNSEVIDTKVKKVNRGYSARRYVRNLTKNWDQNLLDTFISDGKLHPTTVYGNNNNNSNNSEANTNAFKKRRISDDLTVWPQAYKFDESWIAATVDMRSYKFLKAQDFNLNKSLEDEKLNAKKAVKYNEETKQPDTTAAPIIVPSQPPPQTKVNIINPDPIKIFDQRANEVSYKSLNMNEKQRVLSELLFNSALKNISKNRIVILFFIV